MAKVAVDIVANSAGLSAGLKKAEGELASFEARAKMVGQSFTRVGSTMTRDLTLPIIGVGIAAADMAVKFQQQMTLVQTQAGASAGEVKRMSAAVLELAKTSAAQGPTQLAQGLYHLESVGLRGEKAIRALKTSSDAAGMGIANLETVTSALGAAVTSGIKGAQNYNEAMGTLDGTIGAGNMRMEDLAGALGNVLGTAKAVGVTLPELGAAMAVLTDRGMAADEASTRLRMTLALMEKPSKIATKYLADMGLSSTQLADAIRQHGLGAALELLQAAMEKVGNKTRATQDLLGAFGGGRSGTAILTLIQSLNSGVSSYGGKLAQIETQTKTFNEKVAAYHQTAAYKIDHAWAQIQADLTKAGAAFAPIAARMAGAIADVANAFDSLSPTEKKIFEDFALFVAASGPLLLFVGKMAMATKAILELKTALEATKFASMISGLSSVGATAEGAAAEVSALRLGLLGLGALGAIAIPLSVVVSTVLSGTDNTTKPIPVKGGRINQDSSGQWYYQRYSGNRGATHAVPITQAQAQAMAGNALAGVTGTGSSAEGNQSPNRQNSGQTLTTAQVAALWVQAGGDPKYAWVMANIAVRGESGGVVNRQGPVNSNGTVDRGIFQINSVHGYDPGRLLSDPLYNARAAVSIFNGALHAGQNPLMPWTDPVARAYMAQGVGAGAKFDAASQIGPIGGGVGGKLKNATIPEAFKHALAVFNGAATAANLKALTAAETAAIAAVNASDTKNKGAAIDRIKAEYQHAAEKFQSAAAKALVTKILGSSTADAQALKIAEAAGKPAGVILKDQDALLAMYEREASKLQAALKGTSGKARTDIQNALAKVKSSIASTEDGIAGTLQNIAQTAQQALQATIASIEQAADTALGNQYFQNGLQTPSEKLLAQMQAQDTASSLSDALTAAQKQLADDMNGALQEHIVDVATGSVKDIFGGKASQDQITLDQKAVTQAQRAIDENELAIRAAAERAQADKDYAAAQFNLNRDIENLAKNVGTGADVQGKLNDLLGSYGIHLETLSDPGGNSLMSQLETAIGKTIIAFGNLTTFLNNPSGGGAQGVTPASYSGVSSVVASAYAAQAQGPYATGSGLGGAAGMFLLNPPHAATGGFVMESGLAVIHKGEHVIPAGKAGGDTYNFNISGYMGDKQALIRDLRTEFIKVSRRNARNAVAA